MSNNQRQLKSKSNSSHSEIIPSSKTNSIKKKSSSKSLSSHKKSTSSPKSLESLDSLSLSSGRSHTTSSSKEAEEKATESINEVFTGHSKVGFFFQNIPQEQRAKIKLDQEALYSVTDSISADKMTLIIGQLPGITRSSIITDLTSCVGGNVISFARYFKKVRAIELDPLRFKLLQHNVNAILGPKAPVEFINGDAIIEATKHKQDILYMDPPWGGSDYMTQVVGNTLPLYLSGHDIGELCESTFKNHARHVVIKAPVNFDINKFRNSVSVPVKVLHDFRKMILILLDYGPR